MFGYSITGLLIFHNKASLIDYLLINNQLNFGNSVDMTLDVMSRKNVFIVSFIATIFFNIYLILKKRSLLLTINSLLLIFFKIGFNRADHALSYFVIPAATLAVVMIFENSKIRRRIFLLVIGCLFYIGVYPSYKWAPKIRLLPTATNFKIDYASRMQNAYAQYKLDKDLVDIIADSTIDVYPYNNEYLFANKLNYSHRPLFQNYMTLTPVLDKLNK